MDPNANLEEQERISKRLMEDTRDLGFTVEDAYRLAELVLALNEWISKGGFLPTKWER